MLDNYGFKDISAYSDLDAEQLDAVFAGLEAAVEYNYTNKHGCEQNTVIGACIQCHGVTVEGSGHIAINTSKKRL